MAIAQGVGPDGKTPGPLRLTGDGELIAKTDATPDKVVDLLERLLRETQLLRRAVCESSGALYRDSDSI